MAYYDDFPQYGPNVGRGGGWTWDRKRPDRRKKQKRGMAGAKAKSLSVYKQGGKKGGMYMNGGKYEQKD
tara:strand:- start:4640 stop:4846 length:207 start_codon:yes stop_codon:yes gene_type:complete